MIQISGVSEQDYPSESASHDCAQSKEQSIDSDDETDKITIKFVDSSSSLTNTSGRLLVAVGISVKYWAISFFLAVQLKSDFTFTNI